MGEVAIVAKVDTTIGMERWLSAKMRKNLAKSCRGSGEAAGGAVSAKKNRSAWEGGPAIGQVKRLWINYLCNVTVGTVTTFMESTTILLIVVSWYPLSPLNVR